MQSAAKLQKDRQTLRIEQRTTDLEAAIRIIRLDLAEDHFSAVIGKLREAVNLSRGLRELEETVVLLGIELATDLLPRSSRLAKSLLQEALEVDSQKLITRELWTSIKNKEREEAIAAADSAAARQRLQTRPTPAPVAPVPVNTAAASPAEDKKLRALSAWAHAREYQKSGLREEALEQLCALREIDPGFPGLDQEIARCQPASAPASANALVKTQALPPQLKQKLKRNWNHLATAATIIFTVGTLSTAGGLLWFSQSRRTAPPRQARAVIHPASAKTIAVQPPNPDDQAWAAVNPKDPNLVESYLMRFPSGANRARAIQAMTEIRLEHRQSAEVRDTLQQYAAAWTARQARLSPLKNLTLNLSPASTPRIDGDQATITCLRSVSEVDEDGAKKQTPGELVTFLLARRDSGWVINKALPLDPKKSVSNKSTP